MEVKLVEPTAAPPEPEWVTRINDLHSEIEKVTAKISEAEEAAGIPAMLKELAKLQKDLKTKVNEVAPGLDYNEIDHISKKPAHRAGNIKFLRRQDTKRSPRVEELARDYPNETADATEHIFRLGKAEELLGKETVDSYCDHAITYSYELIVLKRPTGPKTMVIEQNAAQVESDRPTKKKGGKIGGRKRRADGPTERAD